MSSEAINLSQIDGEKIEYGVGVAFSGGGIRSAAFSSGVLRRLLHKSVPMDFISTVSGGGFTGSAYLEWKYRHGGKDDPAWHEEFFDQMRRNANTLCTWRNPIWGLFDCLFIFSMILTTGVIIPLLIWLPMAFPAAYLIDYGFGDYMRSGFTCRGQAGFNMTIFNTTKTIFGSKIHSDHVCFPDPNKTHTTTAILVGSLSLALLLFFSLYKISTSRIKEFYRIMAFLLMMLLCFTFIPWLIEMLASSIPIWLRIVILVLGVILWMGIPPLRSTASWCLLIYFYAFVIKWRVYQNPMLDVKYEEKLFLYILWVSAAMFMMNPFLWLVQQNVIHAFYRSRLQKAFYTAKSSGCMGCGGISISDFLPLSRIPKRKSYEQIDGEQDVITLGDLSNIKPYYICNVLVDNWTYKSTTKKDSYTILTLSPHLIERIDDDHEKDFDENFIGPDDVELSDAMATSAAVVSRHMGSYANEVALSLQTLLGLTMGKSWITDRSYLRGRTCGLCIPFSIQIFIACPLLVMPGIEILLKNVGITGHVFIGVFFSFMAIIIIISLLPTGKSYSSRFERFTRWCILNIYQVRYIREVLRINNVGEVPPAILYLSDGGHIENIGLLALLKRRLRRIILADGGFIASDDEIAESLVIALRLAREMLHCSFSGMDGRDIEEDIRDNLVEPINGKYSRFYKFRVHYYEKDLKTNEPRKVGEGQIILLVPRHPDKCVQCNENVTWSTMDECKSGDMKAHRWGHAPSLNTQEVNQLTLACCECCHVPCYQCCSDPICGKFPQHVTANQFFTPAMFSAYHREGYMAALGADVSSFAVNNGNE